MEDKSEIIRAIDSLAEDLNRQLRELRESVDDLRSAIEGNDSLSNRKAVSYDPGGIYAPHIARDEDLERAVQEALNETGATSEKQMGVVIKAARGKLRGKRFTETELDSLVHAHLKGKQ
jgi:uncharacterized protein YqeY